MAVHATLFVLRIQEDMSANSLSESVASAQSPQGGAGRRLEIQWRLDDRLVSERQLTPSLDEQIGDNCQLGATLVDLGVLDPADLKAVTALQEGLTRLDEALNLAAGIRRRLGDLLLQASRITPAQLDVALAEQGRTGGELGRILVRRGWLDAGELDTALEFQRRQAGEAPTSGLLKLGELLVSTGQITREQLEESLARQKMSGRKLGEELVEAGHVRPHQITHALQLQQNLVTAVLIAALSLGSLAAPTDAVAGGSSTTLTVTATVLKHANLKVLAQPASVLITPADIARGYVDVPAASRVEIKSNSPGGYMLVFESQSDFVRQTQVNGLGQDAQLGASGGLIAQPGTGGGMGKATVELGFRFILAENARPGVYAWPMQMSVLPL